MDIFRLTKQQLSAFERLKKAYNELEKMGVGFYNNYGTLFPYQKKYIKNVDDEEGEDGINASEQFYHRLNIENEWTDDRHFIHLTELGKTEFNKEQEEV